MNALTSFAVIDQKKRKEKTKFAVKVQNYFCSVPIII